MTPVLFMWCGCIVFGAALGVVSFGPPKYGPACAALMFLGMMAAVYGAAQVDMLLPPEVK